MGESRRAWALRGAVPTRTEVPLEIVTGQGEAPLFRWAFGRGEVLAGWRSSAAMRNLEVWLALRACAGPQILAAAAPLLAHREVVDE